MAEVGIDTEHQSKKGLKNLSRLKEEYVPHRKSTEVLLKRLGYDPKNHRKLKVEFARLQLESARESEKDELTGLLNEKGFARRMLEELNRAQRTGSPSVLIFLDANKLKSINDNEGHAAGDEMLRKLGNALKDGTRISDVAARLHGDEYAVLLSNTDLDGVDEWWVRMDQELIKNNVSVAAGARFIRADEIRRGEIKGFLEDADARMYIAKEQSKEMGHNVLKT